ncbi:MAG: hypothetical protein KGL70_15270 [Betaproteobacteria bacterium]|nr:hypothetical protein [Betaproteobacteria bacterium]
MQNLTIETLPVVPHIVFGIFDLAIPNLIFWIAVIFVFFAGCWARMPSRMTKGAAPKDRRDAD